MTHQETISGLNRPIHHTARYETGRHSYGGPIRWRAKVLHADIAHKADAGGVGKVANAGIATLQTIAGALPG
jgi:hypothetical protein